MISVTKCRQTGRETIGEINPLAESIYEPASHQNLLYNPLRTNRGFRLVSSRKPGKAGPESGCNHGLEAPLFRQARKGAPAW
jgi:hypothetical protein